MSFGCPTGRGQRNQTNNVWRASNMWRASKIIEINVYIGADYSCRYRL